MGSRRSGTTAAFRTSAARTIVCEGCRNCGRVCWHSIGGAGAVGIGKGTTAGGSPFIEAVPGGGSCGNVNNCTRRIITAAAGSNTATCCCCDGQKVIWPNRGIFYQERITVIPDAINIPNIYEIPIFIFECCLLFHFLCGFAYSVITTGR